MKESKLVSLTAAGIIAASGLVAGCSKKEEPKPIEPAPVVQQPVIPVEPPRYNRVNGQMVTYTEDTQEEVVYFPMTDSIKGLTGHITDYLSAKLGRPLDMANPEDKKLFNSIYIPAAYWHPGDRFNTRYKPIGEPANKITKDSTASMPLYTPEQNSTSRIRGSGLLIGD